MDTFLTSTVTVTKYKELEKHKDTNALVAFTKQRFTERYIEPMRVDIKKKNGFTIMAVSCLMIEALESFYKGWPNSKNKSNLAFCNFFDRNDNFLFMRGYSEDFYKNVRCGILHQGETTNGWHVRRDGQILDKSTKTINAKLFHDEVEQALFRYCEKLNTTDWDSEIWLNYRKKTKAICENCEER